MQLPEWLSTGLTVLVLGGACGLGVACLLAIAWVGWMLGDPRRAVDYRRRVDDALHSNPDHRTRWFTAVRSETAYATHFVLERLAQRWSRTGPRPRW